MDNGKHTVTGLPPTPGDSPTKSPPAHTNNWAHSPYFSEDEESSVTDMKEIQSPHSPLTRFRMHPRPGIPVSYADELEGSDKENIPLMDRLCYQFSHTPPRQRSSGTHYNPQSPPTTTSAWERVTGLERHILQLVHVAKDERAAEIQEELYQERHRNDTLHGRMRVFELDNERFRQKYKEQQRELRRLKAHLSWTKTQKKVLIKDLERCEAEVHAASVQDDE
ncbi:hypothetical protein BJ165DRAFT_1526382 [Panaeolus papilionaceus]|nr:hypothetical protein BJ165DRAFT_1526382 [Panaeolus papilionaceus]